MTETPLGEPPARGGRTRVHTDAAERSRAWRENRRAELAAPPADPAPGGEPALAAAGLALAVEQLREVTAAARTALAGQLERIDAVVGVLTDPDAIERALAGARADADRRVGDADTARVIAQQEAADARRAAAVATARAADAVTAADDAYRRVDELTADTDRLHAEAAAAAHAATVERAAAAGELEEARTAGAVALAAAAAAHAEATAILQQRLDATDAALRDAQTGAARVGAERDSLAGQLDTVRAELTAARDAVAPAVAVAREEGRRDGDLAHSVVLDLQQARHEGQLAVLEAQLDAARALAADRAEQLSRLGRPGTPPAPAGGGAGS